MPEGFCLFPASCARPFLSFPFFPFSSNGASIRCINAPWYHAAQPRAPRRPTMLRPPADAGLGEQEHGAAESRGLVPGQAGGSCPRDGTRRWWHQGSSDGVLSAIGPACPGVLSGLFLGARHRASSWGARGTSCSDARGHVKEPEWSGTCECPDSAAGYDPAVQGARDAAAHLSRWRDVSGCLEGWRCERQYSVRVGSTGKLWSEACVVPPSIRFVCHVCHVCSECFVHPAHPLAAPADCMVAVF